MRFVPEEVVEHVVRMSNAATSIFECHRVVSEDKEASVLCGHFLIWNKLLGSLVFAEVAWTVRRLMAIHHLSTQEGKALYGHNVIAFFHSASVKVPA